MRRSSSFPHEDHGVCESRDQPGVQIKSPGGDGIPLRASNRRADVDAHISFVGSRRSSASVPRRVDGSGRSGRDRPVRDGSQSSSYRSCGALRDNKGTTRSPETDRERSSPIRAIKRFWLRPVSGDLASGATSNLRAEVRLLPGPSTKVAGKGFFARVPQSSETEGDNRRDRLLWRSESS